MKKNLSLSQAGLKDSLLREVKSETNTRKVKKPGKLLYVLGILVCLTAFTYLTNTPGQLLNTGDRYLSENKFVDAYASYKKASQIYPFLGEPHYKLANLYYHLNDLNRANREVSLALDLDKNNLTYLSELENVNKELNKPAELRSQITFWENELKSDPDNRDAWLQLSARYYRTYQTPKAIAALSVAKQIDPNNTLIGQLEEFYTQNP